VTGSTAGNVRVINEIGLIVRKSARLSDRQAQFRALDAESLRQNRPGAAENK